MFIDSEKLKTWIKNVIEFVENSHYEYRNGQEDGLLRVLEKIKELERGKSNDCN